MKKEYIGMLYGKNIYAEIEEGYPKEVLIKWVREMEDLQEKYYKLLNRNWWEKILNIR